MSGLRPATVTRSTPATVVGVCAGLMTFAVCLPGLGRSLDFDSAQTVGDFVRPGPPWSVFVRQEVFNNHPFFSFLEQLVRVATGRTDAATMRLLPIAFGAATVGLIAWYGARRFSVLAGFAAAGVVAANPTFNDLSREVRGYSLAALCALVASLVLIEEIAPTPGHQPPRPRRASVLYVVAFAVGIATHLTVLIVLGAHVAVIAYLRRLDARWRERFLVIAVLSALAYARTARYMINENAAHGRLFQRDLPRSVAEMALGEHWAAAVLVPVAILGLVYFWANRTARVAMLSLLVAFVLLWAVFRSGALTPRYFVFIVPAVGLCVAAAVYRVRWMALLGAAAAVLSFGSLLGAYLDDPTSYRAAADVIRAVRAGGGRSCVVDVGVPPMRAYVDEGKDFEPITEPSALDHCDVVVVASWWHSNADWYRQDNEVIAAAEDRFPNQTVLESADSALVLSRRPLSTWSAPT